MGIVSLVGAGGRLIDGMAPLGVAKSTDSVILGPFWLT